MFVLATAIDNILHNQAIRRAGWPVTLALIVLLAVLPGWAVLHYRSIAAPLAVTVGAMAGYTGICFVAYSQAHWLPMSLRWPAAGDESRNP